jgi:hypothetical protein
MTKFLANVAIRIPGWFVRANKHHTRPRTSNPNGIKDPNSPNGIPRNEAS